VVVLAAAVVPHPPLLVPDLAAGAAGLVAPLLAACDQVVAGLLAHSPRTVVLVGAGDRTGLRTERETGSLAGFGVPSEAARRSPTKPREWPPLRSVPAPGSVVAAPAPVEPGLPLSLTIGRWLLTRAGWTGDVVLQEVAVGTPATECEWIGLHLATETEPDPVWLALGDGSNRRGPRSPGHHDPRAADFDAEVARAFATGDPTALLALDPGLADQLGAVGRPVWQVLAGAVAADPGWSGIDATVHYDDAPFGVEYLVADWRPRA
jgi:hypothetical protein